GVMSSRAGITDPRTTGSWKGVRHARLESQGGRKGRRPGLWVDHHSPGSARPARAAGHRGARADRGAPRGSLAPGAVTRPGADGLARLRCLRALGQPRAAWHSPTKAFSIEDPSCRVSYCTWRRRTTRWPNWAPAW